MYCQSFKNQGTLCRNVLLMFLSESPGKVLLQKRPKLPILEVHWDVVVVVVVAVVVAVVVVVAVAVVVVVLVGSFRKSLL